MIVNCSDCAMLGTVACADCVVTVILDDIGVTPGASPSIELGTDEASALHHLAEAGLVAPLRLVPRRHDAVGRDETLRRRNAGP